jgi:hypothetical protein
MSKIAGFDTRDDGPGFVGIRFCQEWFVMFLCLSVFKCISGLIRMFQFEMQSLLQQ